MVNFKRPEKKNNIKSAYYIHMPLLFLAGVKIRLNHKH